MNKTINIIVLVIMGSLNIVAQPLFDTNGDWNTSSNWDTGSVPSGTTTAIEIKNNTNPTISTSGSPHTIGSITALGKTVFTVNPSSSLTLGSQADFDLGTFADLALNSNSTLTVSGTLIIYGDLIVDNSLTLTITGTLIIKGDIIMNNGADLIVSGSGSLNVDGDLTGGNNTGISTSGSGTIDVGGDLSVGGGTSSITGGDGTITVGGSCDFDGASCPGTVTPIELLYFSSIENNTSVSLNWATATEENFDYFEIERASQGTSFEFIGEVKGDGNSFTRLDYSFEDESPEIGLNYYRLKSIDLDGTFEYSDVILVKFTSNVKLVVSPNPTFGVVYVKTSIPTSDGLKYEVTNQYGVVVLTGELSAFNNQIDLQGLTKGIYIIRLVDLPTVRAKRIILK